MIVIEDDPSVRRSLRRLIATAGFDVQTFDRPSTFLESDSPISNVCYVIDVHLPEMTGVALWEKLRALGRTPAVILITGHSDERTLEMIRRAKVAAVLFKPFGRDQLLEAISTALRIEVSNEKGLLFRDCQMGSVPNSCRNRTSRS